MRLRILFLMLVAITPSGAIAQTKSDFDSKLILARQGDAGAQNDVGIMLAEGTGVKRNDREAVSWFIKSAEQGGEFGACNLAFHYARGEGVRRNSILAMKWAFISHSLDGLKCFPDDLLEYFRPNKAQVKRAWAQANAWLRSHPNLTNEFGERPWLKGKAQPDNSFNRTRN